MKNVKYLKSIGVVIVLGVATLSLRAPAQDRSAKSDDPALERTRKQVRMLDDIYKGGIVLITTHYVDGTEDLPAGTAFKKLFEAAKKKGHHEVRLLDGTGDPTNDENAPADAFEKKAVAELVAGKAWYEQIVMKDGKRFLRAATPIPVVMEKCTMCHSNYEDVSKGQAIGALGYTIPIE